MTRRLDRLLGEVKSFRTAYDCTALKIKEPPGTKPPGTVRRDLPPGEERRRPHPAWDNQDRVRRRHLTSSARAVRARRLRELAEVLAKGTVTMYRENS
jgi:hypothetical protein